MKKFFPVLALLALPACLDDADLAADSQDANTALPPPASVPSNSSVTPAEIGAGDAVARPVGDGAQ